MKTQHSRFGPNAWPYSHLAPLVTVLLLVSCSNGFTSGVSSVPSTESSMEAGSSYKTEESADDRLCTSLEDALKESQFDQYGVSISNCGSLLNDTGDSTFILVFNDPAEWQDLLLALGEIPEKEAAQYAFWRLPLGILSIGFMIAEKDPNDFDEMIINFENPKMTTYDILPSDISYVLDIPDAYSKEEFSKELNDRIDKISKRVEVLNLNE